MFSLPRWLGVFLAFTLVVSTPFGAYADSSAPAKDGTDSNPFQPLTNLLDEAGQIKDHLVNTATNLAWQLGSTVYQLVVGDAPSVDTSGNTQGSLPPDFISQWQSQSDAMAGSPPVSPTGDLLNTIPGCVGGDAACVTSDPNVYQATPDYNQQRSDLIAQTSGDPAGFSRTTGSLIEATSGGLIINTGNVVGVYDNPTGTWVEKGLCGTTASAQTCNAPTQPSTLSISSNLHDTTYRIDLSYANALLAALANWHCKNVLSEINGCEPGQAAEAIQIEESAHQIAAGIGYQNGNWNQYQAIGGENTTGIESAGSAFSSDLTAQAVEVEGLGAGPVAGGSVGTLISQGLRPIGSGRPCVDSNDAVVGSVKGDGFTCDSGTAAAGFWYVNYDGNGNPVGLTFLTVTQQMLKEAGCPDPCNPQQKLTNFGHGSGLPGASPAPGGTTIGTPNPTLAPTVDFVWGLPGSEGLLPATVNGPDVSSSPWKGLIGQPVGIKEIQPLIVIAPSNPGPGVEKWIPTGQPAWQMECYLALDCDSGGSFATAAGDQITKTWDFSSYLQPHSIGSSPSGAVDPTTGQVYDERGYLVVMTQIYDHYTSYKTCEGGSPASLGHPAVSCHDVWHWNPPVQVPSTASHAIMVRQYKSVLAGVH